MKSLIFDLPDLAATEAFGRRLGGLLFPGAILGLIGPLGAGKTHLCRAIAEGLGIANAGVVTSPTFVLIQEYEARLPIYHFDAYRLPGDSQSCGSQFRELGVDEYFEGEGVCLVEWADRVQAVLPADILWIELSVNGELARRARLEATGPRHAQLLKQVAP